LVSTSRLHDLCNYLHNLVRELYVDFQWFDSSGEGWAIFMRAQKSKSAIRRVALIYDATLAYDLKVMAGVAAYIQEKANFNIYIEENALKDQRLPDLRSWRGHGIIADMDDPIVAKAVARSNLPTVGFGGGGGGYSEYRHIPYFFTNNQEISSLAADHLLGRGFRQFGFCGFERTSRNGWCVEREREFRRSLAERGFNCQVYSDFPRARRQWAYAQRQLTDWLNTLPKPIGVMAANDIRARHLLEACRTAGLRVPEDVAVVGVDNDELLCQLSCPPLTSIEQGAKRIGYEAASLLDQLMSGRQSREKRLVISPIGLVTRQSTDFLAIDDQAVEAAMAYIREHVPTGIKVASVVDSVGISRTSLEIRFRQAMGCTVHSAIRRVQLEQTRRLIAETTLPLKQIAANVGFRSVQHMTSSFGKDYHQSPGSYRRSVALR
jgi:LacI family transcriptional regulator